MAECWLGRRRIHERNLYARAYPRRRTSPRHRDFHGIAGPLAHLIALYRITHPGRVGDLRCIESEYGVSCVRAGLLPHGLLSSAGRSGHYQHHDGIGPQALHGTRAEYVLFLGTLMQLAFSFIVGTASHTKGLAQGFAIVGCIYLLACFTGSWPARDVVAEPSGGR